MIKIMMIRPSRFAYNAQTAVNNAFQQRNDTDGDVNAAAQVEFDQLVTVLRRHQVDVLVIEDTVEPHTPDSIFPNNWISFHEGGKIALYPMFAPNRRQERKPHILEFIQEHFSVNEILDFTHFEDNNTFLEGTGSLVFDRTTKTAYGCISPRTDARLAQIVCTELGYQPVLFDAYDRNGQAIYHTNVMMCVADSYIVINLESIHPQQRKSVERQLHHSGKEIVAISQRQMEQFAGNMLQVRNEDGVNHLVMSTQAWESLETQQQKKLEAFNQIIHSPLNTIETNGGGSARCMMAEMHLSPIKL